MSTEASPVVCLINLGCPKNLVDGEWMLGRLEQAGYRLTHDPEASDVIIVNTCAFIREAQQEAIDHILEMARLKASGRPAHLVVAGCLSERHGGELKEEMPEIDAVIGPGMLSHLVPLVRRLVEGKGGITCTGTFEAIEGPRPRVRTGSPHTAYVKIAEGCDHRCAYCLIPRLRGPYRSRSPEEIRQEVIELAGEGVQEAILVAQDTTAYGGDRRAPTTLLRLLEVLETAEAPAWIRVMYTHPGHWDEALIDRFGAGGRLLPYVDLPIQHISNRVLRHMGRGHDGDSIRRLVERLREKIPRLVLRTTVLVGHPGEGRAEFEELLRFLQEFPFDRLGAFAYSPEDGTRSANMEPSVHREEAEERRSQILELQRNLSFTQQGRRKGQRLDLLVEGIQADRGYLVGRTYGEAPEIDGLVVVKGLRTASHLAVVPGEFLPIRITGAGPYDLVAAPAGADRDIQEKPSGCPPGGDEGDR